MMESSWQSIAWVALALVLPVSALIARRLSWQRWIVMALAWGAIFAVTAALIAAVRG